MQWKIPRLNNHDSTLVPTWHCLNMCGIVGIRPDMHYSSAIAWMHTLTCIWAGIILLIWTVVIKVCWQDYVAVLFVNGYTVWGTSFWQLWWRFFFTSKCVPLWWYLWSITYVLKVGATRFFWVTPGSLCTCRISPAWQACWNYARCSNHPAMLPGATGFVRRERLAYYWSMMKHGVLPDWSSGLPGLELLPCSAPNLGHQEATVATRLDNDAMLSICRLKQQRTDELGAEFPKLLQTQDLGKVALDIVTSDCGGFQRNCLMDIVVLTLAEYNRCNNRSDFDVALKNMLGTKLDTIWYSRFHNSVYHVLRLNGVPCFKQKYKKTRRVNVKTQRQDIGPVIPETLLWLGGPERWCW